VPIFDLFDRVIESSTIGEFDRSALNPSILIEESQTKEKEWQTHSEAIGLEATLPLTAGAVVADDAAAVVLEVLVFVELAEAVACRLSKWRTFLA